MTVGDRFKKWIEDTTDDWKDKLRGWALRSIGEGITKTLEDMEPGAIDSYKDILTKVKDDPLTPAEFKTFYEHALEPGNWLTELIAGMTIALGALPALMSAGVPLGNKIRYAQENFLHSFRLDPQSIITAWRRDKPTYEKLFDDLKDQGWDEDRIKALKFFTLYYPSPAELIHWTAREVFEPEMVEKYGLKAGVGKLRREDFYKAGMDDYQIDNHWIAHWEHASWMQIVEMLHRGLITEQDVKDWFPLVEMAPHWADLLIQTAYTWPTRVDVRRWWDMRTIDETELRRLYSGMGYRGVNLDNYVLWTKVYVGFPDLLARWSNGWITEDDVRNKLLELGMPKDRVEEMIETKKKAVEAGQVEEGKALTKTEIYKGVKEGRITRDEGVDLLMDLNYNLSQAEYLLDVNVGALEGSPHTYEEFKDITTKYRLAIGKEAKPMTEELKAAADEVVRLTGEVKSLERSIVEEKRGLIGGEMLPTAATARLTELQVSLHRAEAELARVKSEYDGLVAEWRHGG